MKTHFRNPFVTLATRVLSSVNLPAPCAFGQGTAFSHLWKICVALVLISAALSPKAAVLTVTSLADSGAGSLRDQVAASSPGDTIQFAITGTILLSSAINITHTLNVEGPGPSGLVIDANHVDRAFVTGGDPVLLSGMEIKNGFVVGTPGADGGLGQNGMPGGDAYGGAILNDSNSVSLILSNCWIHNNTAQGGSGGRGGDNSPFEGNGTVGNGSDGGRGIGGALYATGDVFVANCTFSYNSAVGGDGGDGGNNTFLVAALGGIGGNGGSADGGAVHDTFSGNVTFKNSTFGINRADGGSGGNGGDSSGGPGGQGGNGGPSMGGAIATLIASFYDNTIQTNFAYGGTPGSGGFGAPPGAGGLSLGGIAGGIFGSVLSCASHIGNTIIALNVADGSHSNYFIGFTDDGYNFISTADYVCSPLATTTQAGSVAMQLSPNLGPLGQYGGGLPTFPPREDSPVLDQGYSFGLSTDERGAPRPYSFGLPVPPGGDGSDIGAVELGSSGLGLGTDTNNNLILSWPAYYGDLTLQFATSLLGSSNWSVVPDTPVVVGSQFVVTNRMINAMQFYRLMSH